MTREMRLRINGPHAMVVEIAARIASRDGRAPRESRNFKNSDLPPRSRTALSIASGRGSLTSAAVATKSTRMCSSTLIALQSKPSSRESNKPEWAKRSISLAAHASARSTRLGPMMAAAAAITVFGELPPSRAASAAIRAWSPTRLVSAATAMSSMARSFSPAISCTSGSAKLASSGKSARSSTECPCTLVTWVFESITVAPDLSFIFWRGMTAPICRLSALIWPLYGAIASITGRARYGGSDKP